MILTPVTSALAADDETGIWAIFSMTDAFPSAAGDSRWRYAFDAQARYFDLGSGVNQYVLRPAVGYQAASNLQVWLGYGRFRLSNAAGRTVDENRYFQQLNWAAGEFGGGKLAMRARLIQRSVSSGDDLGIALRLLTKYTRPIGDSGTRKLIFSIEPFFDVKDTDWGGDSGLTQNRIYVGIGWKLSDKLALETGYLNQYFWRDNTRNRRNNLAIINFALKL